VQCCDFEQDCIKISWCVMVLASGSSVFYLHEDLRIFVIKEYVRVLGLILYCSLNTFLVILQ